jgi:hypothetical protein
VEDALLRLDSLTKEESLMAVARNLAVTHDVVNIVRGVDSHVKETKGLTENIGGQVKVIDSNVEKTKDGGQRFPSSFTPISITEPLPIMPSNRDPRN